MNICPPTKSSYWLKGLTNFLSTLTYLIRFKHGANNTKVMGSIPIWTIHLRVELEDPCRLFLTQNILWSVKSDLIKPLLFSCFCRKSLKINTIACEKYIKNERAETIQNVVSNRVS